MSIYMNKTKKRVKTILQSFSARFNFLHLSTLPRSDFPGSHWVKNSTGLFFFFFFFERAHYKVFILFLCFLSWRMQTLQRARNVWRLNLQISQDGTFVHYPFFCIEHAFAYFLFSDSRYLFVLTYFDSSRRHTHATNTRQGRK